MRPWRWSLIEPIEMIFLVFDMKESKMLINDNINDKIKSVLLKISELGIAKRKDLHDAIKISMPTIDRILKQLISEDLNLIEYQGSRKTGGYVLTEKGKAFIKSMNE